MPTSYTKLSIIQNACLALGDTPPQVEDDGSAEWDVASAGYDRMMAVLAEEHNWKWATRTVALVAAPTPNPSVNPDFLFNYLKPAGGLHLMGLTDQYGAKIQDYEIIAGQIATFVNSGVMAKYIVAPGPEVASAMFCEALTLNVEALLIQGLHEDKSAARTKKEEAEIRLMRAKPRSDSEEPARDFLRGRISERRRGWVRV